MPFSARGERLLQSLDSLHYEAINIGSESLLYDKVWFAVSRVGGSTDPFMVYGIRGEAGG